MENDRTELRISAYSRFEALHVTSTSRVCTCFDKHGKLVVIKAYCTSGMSSQELAQVRTFRQTFFTFGGPIRNRAGRDTRN